MADDTSITIPDLTGATQPPTDKPAAPAKDPYAPQEVSLEEAMSRFGEVHAGKPRKRKPVEEGGIGRQAGDPVKPKEAKEIKDEKSKAGPDGDVQTGKGDKEDEQEEKPKQLPAGQAESDGDTQGKAEKAKPEKRKAREPRIDEERIAEIVANAAAKASADAVTKSTEQQTKQAEKTQEQAIPDEYKDRYEVLKSMAEKNKKNADLPNKLIEFAKQEDAYIKQWKRENPGVKWNSEDEQHSDFYDTNTPNWDEGEYRKAEIALAVKEHEKEIREKVMSEIDPRLKKIDELEKTEKLRDLAPQVMAIEKQTMGAILETINKDYANKFEPADLKKLAEDDPAAFEVAIELGSQAIPFAAEVTRLWNSNGAIKADQNNPLHQHIFGYGQEVARLIKQLPQEDQVRDNKQFATWTEYAAMSQRDQAQHWTLTGDDLIKRKILDAQELAKEKYSAIETKFSEWATKRGLAKSSAQNVSQNGGAKPLPKEEKPAPDKDKLPSPSTTGRTGVASDTTKTAAGDDSYMDNFANVLAGRRV